MSARVGEIQGDVQSSERGIRRGESRSSSMPKTLSAGMGTKNFVTEILDTFAILDRDRKQQLINYTSQLAEAQRAEQSLLAL